MKRIRVPQIVLVLMLSFSAGAVAQSAGWLDRWFQNRQGNRGADQRTPVVQPHAEALNLQNSFAKVAEAVKPAVVNIAAVQITRVQQQDPYEFYFGDPNEFFHRFFGEAPPGGPRRQQPRPREFRQEGTGSGVIIDPDGFILTNNHVVQGADQLTVTLSDGKSFKGKVVGTDSRTDLAVIRIKGGNPFPFAPLGDSGAARIGDWVLAVGSPFGLEQTVTAGIISAIRQSLTIEGRSFRNLIQTDAAINRGNSGGPLVNIRGEVVGINTAIYAPTGVFSGIGFAIPVNDAKLILKELIEKGFVERSWMGVEIAEVDEVIAGQFGLSKPEGALVNQIVPDGPADKAGLRRGDIILQFDGKAVTNVQMLQDIVSATAPNKTVTVKILREGDTKTLKLKTAQMPNQSAGSGQAERDEETEEAEPSRLQWMGAGFVENNAAVRRQFGVDEQEVGSTGVILTELPPDSVAAEAGLMEGDVIRAVNRLPVRKLSDLKSVSEKVDLKKGVVLDVMRRGKSFYLSYKAIQ